jgi:hypothetical protein
MLVTGPLLPLLIITEEKVKLVFCVNEPVTVGGFVEVSSLTVNSISRP